jgi:hypothetical protein
MRPFFALPLLLAIAGPTLSAPPATDLQAGRTYIQLQNGNVIFAELHAEGDRVRITGEGSEWYLPKSQVVRTTCSLEELYAAALAPLSEDDIPRRIALADWCLRYGLRAHATELLAGLTQEAPDDGRVELLRRRIAHAERPTPTTAKASPQVENAEAKRVAASAQIHSLPPGAVEDFTRRVQPILVNNCTASGCHRPGGGQQLQLHRELLFGHSDQRSTTANLISVLAAIDRTNPEASKLLAALRGPHAGSLTPRLDGRRGALREEVEAWTNRVAGQPIEPQAIAKTPTPRRDEAVEPAAFEEQPLTSAEEVRIAREVEEWAAANEPKHHARPQFGVRLRPVKPAVKPQPRDEFDPVEFNDR